MNVDVFDVLSRYFWLICLVMSGIQYVTARRRLELRGPLDERARAAMSYQNWLITAGAAPWLVVGAGHLTGSTPTIWYYFRPQDLNPFVLGFVAVVFLFTVLFAYWVFVADGARKAVEHRVLEAYGMSGQATLTERQVKLFAGMGPPFIALWVAICVYIDAPVPK